MALDPKYFDHDHKSILVEDLKIDGEKEAICMVCEEPSSKPYTKCSICNWHRHESCSKLPDEIEHPLHPIHRLHLRLPRCSSFCHACGKCCKRCYFYTCFDCDFNLDIKCSSRWRENKDDGHQHIFVLRLKESQFTCELCGEEGKDVRCVCSICQLLVHSKCASFLHTINIVPHSHSLVLKYSSSQVKEQADTICKLCSLKVNTKYVAYYCRQCSYATHLLCARDYQFMEDKDAIDDSTPTDINQWFTRGYVSGLIKDINSIVTTKIRHSSHQHDLILNYKEVSDDKVCDGCMQLISVPFYSCAECNFNLHYLCANLPTSIGHLNLPVAFNLVSQLPSFDSVFQCFFCDYNRHGSIMVLDLAIQRCVSFPPEAKYKDDEHTLKLTYVVEDESQEYYCRICKKEGDRDHWFYYCAECNFAAHPQCVIGKYPYIKFGKTYKDEHYQHPLTFIQMTEDSSLCNICGLPFNGVALHCKECKLNVHPRFEFDCLSQN